MDIYIRLVLPATTTFPKTVGRWRYHKSVSLSVLQADGVYRVERFTNVIVADYTRDEFESAAICALAEGYDKLVAPDLECEVETSEVQLAINLIPKRDKIKEAA